MNLSTILELTAALLTLLCVWLTFKDLRSSWIIGSIACVVYGIVFWNQKLYADFGLQVIFFIQGIYGYVNWGRVKKREANPKYLTVLIFGGAVCWFVLYSLLKHTDASYPAIDGLLSVYSLVANQALAFHWRQAWLMWIIIDVVYVCMFTAKGMWYSVILYVILAVVATFAFKQWKTKNITLA